MEPGLQAKFFTYHARLNRKPYLIRNIWLWIISCIASGMIHLAFVPLMVIGAILSIASGISNLMLSIRRCHDIGKSGWWLLLLVIPVVNIIFYLYLYLKKGTTGPNSYGPDPLEFP